LLRVGPARLRPTGGTLIGTTSVPKATASELSTRSAGTVYRVGRKIYLLAGGAPKLVSKARGTPIGLSFEGKRIAWTVDLKGQGRVVALTLGEAPRRDLFSSIGLAAGLGLEM